MVAAACMGMLLSAAGCTTIASMAVKHVATKAGMSVAKDAYHKIKGDDAKGAAQPADVQREILVTSNPSGAKIYVNSKYVGDAPVQVSVDVDTYGVTRNYTIKAVPKQKGPHVQKYRLLHYQGEPSDQPPGKIAFDMSMVPAR